MKTQPILLTVCLIICLSFTAKAQVTISTEALNAGGSTLKKGDVILECSIGEMMAVYTATTTQLIVSKGVLQPARQNNSNTGSCAIIQAYPTLVTAGMVNLDASFTQQGNLRVAVINAIGQEVTHVRYNVKEGLTKEKLLLQQLPKGAYIIQVIFTSTGNEITCKQNFKIIKS